MVPADRITKTKVLNRLSNIAVRTVLYGSGRDRQLVAAAFDSAVPHFAAEWCGGEADSQECRYLQAISLFLKEGLAATEAAVIYPGGRLEFETQANVCSTHNLLTGTSVFNNSSASSTSSEGFGRSDINGGASEVTAELENVPRLRLLDVYLNVFYRVVALCVTAIGEVMPCRTSMTEC